MPVSFLLQALPVHAWITTDAANHVIHAEEESL
jgi:hypothetical protein